MTLPRKASVLVWWERKHSLRRGAKHWTGRNLQSSAVSVCSDLFNKYAFSTSWLLKVGSLFHISLVFFISFIVPWTLPARETHTHTVTYRTGTSSLLGFLAVWPGQWHLWASVSSIGQMWDEILYPQSTEELSLKRLLFITSIITLCPLYYQYIVCIKLLV